MTGEGGTEGERELRVTEFEAGRVGKGVELEGVDVVVKGVVAVDVEEGVEALKGGEEEEEETFAEVVVGVVDWKGVVVVVGVGVVVLADRPLRVSSGGFSNFTKIPFRAIWLVCSSWL